MDSEEQRTPHVQFMENQYVRVYGVVKQLQGQKIVQAFKILPIKDLNEVTHHILECMDASIYYATKVDGEPSDMPVGRANNPLKSANLTGAAKAKLSFNEEVWTEKIFFKFIWLNYSLFFKY
jgi:replication factor A2